MSNSEGRNAVLQRCVPLLVWLSLTVAATCFFALRYPFHLLCHESLQMFLFTADYWWQTVSVPGGLADYVASFLTQFFVSAWIGGLIMGLLVGSMSVLVWLAVSEAVQRVWSRWSIVSAVPVVWMFVYALNRDAMVSAQVSVVVSLGYGCLLVRCRRDVVRWLVEIVGIPILYMAVGPVAVLAVGLAVLREVRACGRGRWLMPVLLVFLSWFLPQLAHRLFALPLESLYLGVHYFRYVGVHPPQLWHAVVAVWCAAIAVPWADRVVSARMAEWHKWTAVVVAVPAYCGFVLLMMMGRCEFNQETLFKYNHWAANAQWHSIINEARHRMPAHPQCVACINMALAQTGQLTGRMFEFHQPSPHALLPRFEMSQQSAMAASNIYFALGWMNMALRLTYEAQELIPDFQQSAPCYKRLAQIHIVRNEPQLALKYLEPLTHTLYYSQWAQATVNALHSNRLPDEYARMAKADVQGCYFYDDNLSGLLSNYQPSAFNRPSNDCMQALALLLNSRSSFLRLYSASADTASAQTPLVCQQALLMFDAVDSVKCSIADETREQYDAFRKAVAQGYDVSQLRRYFGQTYWWYAYASQSKKKRQANDAPSAQRY